MGTFLYLRGSHILSNNGSKQNGLRHTCDDACARTCRCPGCAKSDEKGSKRSHKQQIGLLLPLLY